MPLTDTVVRKAKPRNNACRLFDERGLYAGISPAGGKWSRIKCRFKGKEKRLSLGTYPSVVLREAGDRKRASAERGRFAYLLSPKTLHSNL
jgi:hypothetical protein